jgi:abortive infection bacteriophage resistance protein
MLSRFYVDLPTHDQKQLAKELFGLNPKILSSWLRCCTDLRNICAHHGRLYYRLFPAVPAGLPSLEEKDRRHIFGILMALKILYPDKPTWNSEVFNAIDNLVTEYQADIKMWHIGFPKNWRELLKHNA